jgi:hypothetical protein
VTVLSESAPRQRSTRTGRTSASRFVSACVLSSLIVATGAHADGPCGTTGIFETGVTNSRDSWEGSSVGLLSRCVYTTVGMDSFAVPPYQPEVMFAVYGAGDGYLTDLSGLASTGHPGLAVGRLAVTPGEAFDIRVGGLPTASPADAIGSTGVCDIGGFNGGGQSGSRTRACGGAGASDVRPAGGGLGDRLFVGGGAGGNAFCAFLGTCGPGGDGGGESGSNGENGICSGCPSGSGGGGGSQTAAGASPGNANSAGFGFGGSGGTGLPGVADGGAGGGGGYYGGGGTGATAGHAGGGGGGSGYVTPSAIWAHLHTSVRHVIYGDKDIFNGIVFVQWPAAPVTATMTLTADHDSPVARGTVVTLTASVTTSTGMPGVGTVTISRYADGSGACPCSNIGQGVLDPDGTLTVRINPGTMSFGPHHLLVAKFQDHYGIIGDTSSNSLQMNVLPSDQTLAFTSSAPTNAFEFGPTYSVSASASSGLAASFSIPAASASVCSVSGSTVSFLAPGVCLINADQAGNAFYNRAPTVQQQVQVAEGGGQRITFTSLPPANPKPGDYPQPEDLYTPTAVGGGSGNPVVFSSDRSELACFLRADGRVQFFFGGTCRIFANQAGGNGFAAAPQAEQTFTVPPRSTAVIFGTTPPSSPSIDDTYTVSATTDVLVQLVTLTLDASSTGCSLTNVRQVNTGLGYFRSEGTVTFTGAGTCIINGDSAARDPEYAAAPTAQQIIAVGGPTATPTQTATQTPTVDATETATLDATETATVDATGTPTSNATETSTVDATPTATLSEPTFTPTPSPVISSDACQPLPRSNCQQPRRASEISLRAAAPRVRWEWFGTLPTTAAGLGDPVSGATGYHLCIYDTPAGLPHLAFSATVPPGGTCGARPCWKQTRKRLAYTNNAATPDGIRHLTLSAGGSRKAASIIVNGRGPNLRLPASGDGSLLRAALQVIVQLQRSDAADCWEARFDAPATLESARTFADRLR